MDSSFAQLTQLNGFNTNDLDFQILLGRFTQNYRDISEILQLSQRTYTLSNHFTNDISLLRSQHVGARHNKVVARCQMTDQDGGCDIAYQLVVQVRSCTLLSAVTSHTHHRFFFSSADGGFSLRSTSYDLWLCNYGGLLIFVLQPCLQLQLKITLAIAVVLYCMILAIEVSQDRTGDIFSTQFSSSATEECPHIQVSQSLVLPDISLLYGHTFRSSLARDIALAKVLPYTTVSARMRRNPHTFTLESHPVTFIVR